MFKSIFSFSINIPISKPKKVVVNIPNVISFRFGVHYFSPESLDDGFPIRIDSGYPLTVSNVLFASKKGKTLKNVLYVYALPKAQTIHQTGIILVPWKEAFKAAYACMEYTPKKHWKETFHIAVYDHFTDGMYISEAFVPLFLQKFAVECDQDLDQLYKKAFGFSLRELSRAETLEERRKIVGLSDKNLDDLKSRLKSLSKN